MKRSLPRPQGSAPADPCIPRAAAAVNRWLSTAVWFWLHVIYGLRRPR